MRHRSGQRKLNITDGAHRIAMMRNISNSLIRHERIKTTLIRAKELRRFLEPLITLGKTPTVANRRLAFARLQDRESVSKLFDDLGARFNERPGGYLRILKHGFRAGDNAPMALVELMDRKTAEELAAERDDKPAKPKKEKKRAKKAAEAEEAAADADDEEAAEAAEDADEESAEQEEAADDSDEKSSGDDAGADAEEQEGEDSSQK